MLKLVQAFASPGKCTLALGKLDASAFLPEITALVPVMWISRGICQSSERAVELSVRVLRFEVKLNRSPSEFQFQAELVAKPSVSVEFVTNMGIIIPDFAKSGVQMNTNFFHESGLEARVALKAGELKVTIPAPKRPVKLFSGR